MVGEPGAVNARESRQSDVEHLKDIIDMLDCDRPEYQPDWDEVGLRDAWM